MKKIVIIGGGFAGLNLANRLNKKLFQVTLVDRNNYTFFPPLLYQVATAFLEPSNICYPFRKLFRKKKISFVMGELQQVHIADHKITLGAGQQIPYDYLVLATGAETNFFGLQNVLDHAFALKNINDALDLRNHLLEQMEKATATTDIAELNKLLTIVIAGAGPTGLEVAGMLSELRRNIVHKDYPELMEKDRDAHIYLVDGGTAVLQSMSKKSQQDAYAALAKMGVEIKLDMQVKDYNGDTVSFSNGQTIGTKTLVWAAGVGASVFPGLPADCYGRGRRLVTDAYNKIQGLDDVYAIGDTSIQISDSRYPNGHPQLAQVAIQQARNLASNLEAQEKTQALKPFRYFDKGSMAIIGRNRAVADLPSRLHVKGFIAWAMWLFVHLVSLINYRNRITTLYNWTGAYFTKDQSLRMIIKRSKNK